MKRKGIVILVAAIVILALSGIICALLINMHNQTPRFLPKEKTQINYNNYVAGNSVDYRDGRFAWSNSSIFGAMGTVVHADGQVQRIYGADEQIQLLDGGTAFLNRGVLFVNKESRIRVAENVDSFVAIGASILYLQVSDSYESTLVCYDVQAQTSKTVVSNVEAYCVDEHRLIVVDDKGGVTLYTETAVEKKIEIEIPSYPFAVMLQGENLLYKSANQLCLLNLDTGAKRELSLSADGYSNHRIRFICDKERIVYSFQATRTDGSIVTDAESSDNGVWIVDPVILETQKLCEETFGELYLFGDTLIGRDDDGAYQISMKTGELTRIS